MKQIFILPGNFYKKIDRSKIYENRLLRFYRGSIILLLLLVMNLLSAQTIAPVAIQTLENGEAKHDTIYSETPTVGSAPMSVIFEAHVEVPENITYHCQWDFADNQDMDSPFLTRYEENTDYTFDKSGTSYVMLAVTFINTETNKEFTEYSGVYAITISESELKVPNAFSPNGDGINDIFQVTYKSLVKFNAYIFNRWGQELYHWGLDKIDEGWDGTYHGKQVKDGVYFIMIEAEGSDGIKYKHKGDINILRGFTGDGSGVPSMEQ